MITTSSIHALLELLNDSDESVRNHAYRSLVEQGGGLIPEMERMQSGYFYNAELSENISFILKELRFQKIKKDLTGWRKSADKNLLEALYIITTYQFPELEMDEFVEQFQELKYRFWTKINPHQTSFEKVEVLNHIFFEEFQFRNILTLPSTPFDLYLNTVLESREGTDLALGILYSVVAQSIGLPVYGVTTLNHRVPFVLAYLDTKSLLPILDWGIDNNGVLFYIHIMDNGAIFSPKQLREFCRSQAFPQNRAQLEPSAHTLVVKRYLYDLKRSYLNHPRLHYKAKDIEELLQLFQD